MSEARRLHRETKDEGLASSAKELSSESPGWGTRQMAGMISSAISSVLFHATLILLLSAVLIVTHGRRIPTVMTVTLEEIPELGEFLEIMEMIVPEKPLPAALVNAAPLDVRAEPKVEPPDQSDSEDDRAEGPVVATVSLQTAPAEPAWTRDPLGGGLVGRGGRTKAQLARERGGTARSEEAVTQGMKWLAEHQHPGGYWTFDHRDGPCDRRCGNPGSVTTRTGATALALLPFLGAGHTHIEGPYRDVVRKGLNFLSQQKIVSSRGGDLQDGTMYGHGLATIALCEAVAMTGDDRFRLDAQRAVDYIAYAQHSAGGWRYLPRQPGDTTVFGWQFMALKSGQLAGLEVGNRTIASATRFLDRVQSGDGAYCGYLADGQEPTPTAIGLLARMYSGWNHQDPALHTGVAYLADLGPSSHDMYFNYYATQVMHHFGGFQWLDWNLELREHLLATQSPSGHENGSWYFVDKHGVQGGRLYNTAMCVMMLEVYYRFMPLYTERTVDQELARNEEWSARSRRNVKPCEFFP